MKENTMLFNTNCGYGHFESNVAYGYVSYTLHHF